ncbi:MAG: hypothetical protein A2270_06840 [Elusimicrobia bacterium RIFOXYA12_FULL_51_18]|nr:MAG: hypothetical protein A2270_06840 [Elusimicrobia bacterium RIFOXYA12_FULL_51_18]OGS28402.1 MAG: hypothetical protein A2218_05145 [Elusimicrobia bacterium RIFOXYA2_FULL_53_38]
MNYEDAQKQKLIKSEISSKEHSDRFEAKYNELFGGQKLEFAKYDDKVLKELWLASYMMASYTLGQKYVLQMEDIFKNLKRRGIETGECLEGRCLDDLFSIYLRSSDFPKARQLAQQYPAILTDYVPDINEDASVLHKPHRLYKISLDGKSLNLISVQMDDNKKIVALMNPECEFAQQAISAISSTPDLRDYFEKHALIICPVYSSVLSIAKAAEWNKKNPKLEYFVYLDKNDIRKDWKQFDLKVFTDFYFLKNNKIIYRIPGWGPTGKEFIAEMRNAISKLK